MTQNLFKLGAELKQIIFFSNDHIALDFYYLKDGKTQQQGEWMGECLVLGCSNTLFT